MRVELHPGSRGRILRTDWYYEDRQEGLGQRFYREIITHIDWILKNPTIPRLRKRYRRLNVKVFPFYIAYVIKEDLAWVLAIAHSRRKPGYWSHRLSDR